jgi:hypothetical protein
VPTPLTLTLMGPRWVFEDPVLAEAKTVRKLGEAEFQGTLQKILTLGPSDLASRASHSFLHISAKKTADGWDFRAPTYQWASTQALHRLAEAALKQLDLNLLGQLYSDQAHAVKGFLVEALWFERFIQATMTNTAQNKMSLAKMSPQQSNQQVS